MIPLIRISPCCCCEVLLNYYENVQNSNQTLVDITELAGERKPGEREKRKGAREVTAKLPKKTKIKTKKQAVFPWNIYRFPSLWVSALITQTGTNGLIRETNNEQQ